MKKLTIRELKRHLFSLSRYFPEPAETKTALAHDELRKVINLTCEVDVEVKLATFRKAVGVIEKKRRKKPTWRYPRGK
jgi:hypothetical protein